MAWIWGIAAGAMEASRRAALSECRGVVAGAIGEVGGDSEASDAARRADPGAGPVRAAAGAASAGAAARRRDSTAAARAEGGARRVAAQARGQGSEGAGDGRREPSAIDGAGVAVARLGAAMVDRLGEQPCDHDLADTRSEGGDRSG